MKPRKTPNPKKKLQSPEAIIVYKHLVDKVRYGGNPEHKKVPGDFNLSPPSNPRRGKSLCDAAGIFTRRESEHLLREGLKRGMISEQLRANNWPQNIWAVTDNGIPLEGALENAQQGIYHGYPMFEEEAFAQEVLKEWKLRKSLTE